MSPLKLGTLILLCVLAICAAPALAGQPTQQQADQIDVRPLHTEERALLRQVQPLLEAGQHGNALQLLEAYFREQSNATPQAVPAMSPPPHPALFLALGNARYLAGDMPGAYEALRTAHAGLPNDPGACRNLALATYALERWAESAALFEQTAQLQANHASSKSNTSDTSALLRQAAVAWSLAGKHAEAMSAIGRVLAFFPEPDADLLELHAQLHTLAGKHVSGLHPLWDALERHPEDIRLWNALADAELRGKRFAHAAAALETALHLLSQSKQATTSSPATHSAEKTLHERLEGLYAGTGFPAQAARILKMRLDPMQTASPEHLDRLADLLERAQQPRQALDILKQAQAHTPTPTRTRNMALLAWRHGLDAEAAGYLSAYLVLRPDDAEARLLLALAALSTQKKGDALVALDGIPKTSRHFEAAEQLRELLREPDAGTLP